MAVMRPFKAVRPTAEAAPFVAALPYDVMSSAEARRMAADKPLSFLHVDRAEIDLPEDTDIYSDAVYDKAAANLKGLIDDGALIRDEEPCFYLYREIMDGRSQTGIVGCASIDDYAEGVIRKHELTVAAKEADRIRHVDACNANTGLIFLAFRDSAPVQACMDRIVTSEKPIYDFVSEDGVRHSVWRVAGKEDIRVIADGFSAMDSLYIADGHHRAASAYRVGEMRRKAKGEVDGGEAFNYFLAAAFPASELSIWDYNRVVKDLNGMSKEAFLEALRGAFAVSPLPAVAGGDEAAFLPVKPKRKHTFSLYLDGIWYALEAKAGSVNEADPVERLDVSILQDKVLSALLNIRDPRTDPRIKFVGGIRGLKELKREVDAGAAAAFALYPTSMEDLMAIADAGRIMPPKSTWFEPKLRSGLLIHELT